MARQSYILSFLLSALFTLVSATRYSVTKTYAGQHFFDDWVFYNNCE